MNLEETLNSMKLTENGDLAFSKASNNEMLNILFLSEYYQKHLDEVPSIGNSNRAKLFAQFIRDPRLGLGRRDLGRHLLKHTEASIEDVVRCGRVDDLFSVAASSKDDWEKVADYLKSECLKNNELVRKWMPRYSSKNKALAEKLALYYFPGKTYVQRKCAYAKLVRCNTTETYLSLKQTDKIKFEHVPSLASIKYAHRFANGEDTKERYEQFIEAVKSGNATLHVSTTNVYDIYRNRYKIDPDVFFDKIEKVSGSWLPIVDTSASMRDNNDSFGKAVAIGHYLAKTSTYLPDRALAFSSRPQFLILGNDNRRYSDRDSSSQYLKEVESLYTGDCSNTNFASVMNLLSTVGDLPEYLIVLTDMEFDPGSYQAKEAFRTLHCLNDNKVKMIWWNFNSRNITCPETDANGNIFMSGYNPTLLKFLQSGFNGEAFLNRLLDEYEKAIR